MLTTCSPRNKRLWFVAFADFLSVTTDCHDGWFQATSRMPLSTELGGGAPHWLWRVRARRLQHPTVTSAKPVTLPPLLPRLLWTGGHRVAGALWSISPFSLSCPTNELAQLAVNSYRRMWESAQLRAAKNICFSLVNSAGFLKGVWGTDNEHKPLGILMTGTLRWDFWGKSSPSPITLIRRLVGAIWY